MENLPLNLLIFPLVGGYYIITRLESLKYISHRLGSQATIFNAVLIGIPLLVVSLVVSTVLTYVFPEHVYWVKQNVFPIKQEYFGTCLLSIITAYFYTQIRNRTSSRSDSLHKAIVAIGNELELRCPCLVLRLS